MIWKLIINLQLLTSLEVSSLGLFWLSSEFFSLLDFIHYLSDSVKLKASFRFYKLDYLQNLSPRMITAYELGSLDGLFADLGEARGPISWYFSSVEERYFTTVQFKPMQNGENLIVNSGWRGLGTD